MALPGFYNQGDQEIYASGDKFIPQEQYRLGYTAPPSIANAATTSGITNTQAANPYIYPQGGGGGGGGGGGFGGLDNKYGLDLDTQKTVTVGMANAEGVYEPTPIKIAKSPGGIWKNKETGQNVYHGNIGVKGVIGTVMNKMFGKKNIPGVPDEGSTTGAEWDEEFDPTISGKKLNTYQRWKAKKEFKKEQEKAAADKIAADAEAAQTRAQGRYDASVASGRTGGHWYGGSDYKGGASGDVTQAGPGRDPDDRMAQGGRIGYNRGRVVNPGGYNGADNTWQGFLASQDEWQIRPGDEDWRTVYHRWLDSKKAEGGRIGYAYGTPDPEEPAENVFEIMQDQGVPFSEQVEGGPTEEQIAMVMDMDSREMGIDEIVSLTGLGKEVVLSILGVEMAQGGIARLL